MEEFHTPAARREKSGHYFYKPLVFSRCVSSAMPGSTVDTCSASVWKLMEAIHMFYGVVNLDPVADTRPTLQCLFYDHADWRSMYS